MKICIKGKLIMKLSIKGAQIKKIGTNCKRIMK